MAYKLRSPFFKSGGVNVFGMSYEIKTGPDGKGYVEVDTMHAANFLMEHSGYELVGFEKLKASKKIVIRRGRGIGDVLMVTPLARKLKQQDPEKHIILACDIQNMDILRYVPYIDRIVLMSQVKMKDDKVWVSNNKGDWEEQDYCINLEMHAETHPDNDKVHRVDLFCKAADFPVPLDSVDRRLEYRATEDEIEDAKRSLRARGWREGDKLLTMAVRSTCANRNMLPSSFRQIAAMAERDGWKTVVLDHDGAFGWEAPGVINMAGKTTIRQGAALIAASDMFFGPDTGFWHLACALRVPNVVYFGAMDWKLRVTGPSRVIFRNVTCYPCNKYDCQWKERNACIAIGPEYLWDEILAYHREIGANKASTHILEPAGQENGHRPVTVDFGGT